MMKAQTLCNISEEVLTRQLIIESIPMLTMLGILALTTLMCFYWAFKKRSHSKFQLVFACLCVVFFPTWYKMSFYATAVATNLFNPEYAVIEKFVNGCPKSLQQSVELSEKHK